MPFTDPPPVIQYYTKKLSFSYFFKCIKPFIVVIIALYFVSLSVELFPVQASYPEKPIYSFPYYMVLVSFSNSLSDEETVSHLSSNLPAFGNESIISFQPEPIYSVSSDKSGFHNLKLKVPYNVTADFLTPFYVRILIPYSLTINKISIPQLLDFSITQNNIRGFSVFGDVLLDQKIPLNDSLSVNFNSFSIDHFLPSPDKADLPDFLSRYNYFPITSSFAQKKYSTFDPKSKFFEYNIQLRTSDWIIVYDTPFWYNFKQVFVQIFYWIWIVLLIWNVLVDFGFSQSVFTAEKRIILDGKQKTE